MTQFNFNARNVEPDSGRVGAMPSGWYPSILTKTEIKPTNGGGGAYIAVQGQVQDGPHKGASWFTNFNIQNENPKAVEIGMRQLSSLCHATGVLEFNDTDMLKNKPFFVRLKKVDPEYNTAGDPNSGIKYEEKNEVTAYRGINDQAAIDAVKRQGVASAPAAVQNPSAPPAFIPQQQQQQFAPQQQQQQQQQQPAPQQFVPQQQQAPQQVPQQWAQQQQQPVQQVQQQQQPVQQPQEQQPAWAGAAAAQPWGQEQQPQQQQSAPNVGGTPVDQVMPAWMQPQQ